MTGEVSGLEDHLGYWLRSVSNQASHAFQLKLAGRGVTVAEWAALREMFDVDSMPPSQLAERLGMTRGAISKLAERLEAKGLLSRAVDGSDGRRQFLALTPPGRALVPDLAALADLNDEEFFSALDPAVRKTIEMALKEIIRRLGVRAVPLA